MKHPPQELVVWAWEELPEDSRALPLGLAVSGGVDSMVLLEVVAGLWERGPAFEKAVVLHLDHGLREESVDDAAFVRERARHHGLHVEIETVDLSARRHSGSLEALARDVRYAWLAERARTLGLGAILTAHHADDQAETVLMQMMRGTGVLGLGGMPESRPLVRGRPTRIVRPFLPIPREVLVEYAKSRQIPWREDASNRDLRHRRNLVRHVMLPLMGEENDASGRLLQLGVDVREANRRIAKLAAAVEADVEMTIEDGDDQRRGLFRLIPVKEVPTEVAYLLIDRLIKRCDPGAPPLSPKVFARLIRAAGGEAFTLELTRDLHVSVEPGDDPKVCVRKTIAEDSDVASWPAVELPLNEAVRVQEAGREFAAEVADESSPSHSPFEQWLPEDAVRGRLMVRRPDKGERMEAFGLGGSKLVSDLLNEAKVPAFQRWGLAVVADEGGILWIPGVRAAERCRITTQTGSFVRLTVREI